MQEKHEVISSIERNPGPCLYGETVLEDGDLEEQLSAAEKQLRAAVAHQVVNCARRGWLIRVESNGGTWLDVQFAIDDAQGNNDTYIVRRRLL